MSLFNLNAQLERILETALVPTLRLVQDELLQQGYVSKETLDTYSDHIVTVMRFVQPFFPFAQRFLLGYAPQLLVVLSWAQELYTVAVTADSTQ